MILASVVLSQYTRITDRQTTTYHDNSQTLQTAQNIRNRFMNNAVDLEESLMERTKNF